MVDLVHVKDSGVQVRHVRVPAGERYSLLGRLNTAPPEGESAEFAWIYDRAPIIRGPRIDTSEARRRSLQLVLSVIAPAPAVPTAPTNLFAVPVSETQIDLSWDASVITAPPVFAQYLIYRDGVYVGSSLVTSYEDTGLVPWTQYSYTVVAQDTAPNVSAPSDPATARTLDTTAPGSPSGLTATNISAGTVQLSWAAAVDAASGVALYQVFVDGVLAGSVAGVETTLTGVSGGTRLFAVRAVDVAGNTGASISLSFSVDGPTSEIRTAVIYDDYDVIRVFEESE